MAEVKKCVILTEDERACLSDVLKLCEAVCNSYGEYSMNDLLVIFADASEYDNGRFTVPEIINL